MKLNDQIKFIRQNMKKNKLRVWMTILATTMGCSFLIVLASIGFGVHESVQQDMGKYQILTEIRVHGKNVNNNYSKVNDEDVTSLKEREDIQAVVSRLYVHRAVSVEMNDRSSHNSVILTDMGEELKANFELSEGRVPTNKNEVIVGFHFSNYLFTKEELDQNQRFFENGEGEEAKGYEGDLLGKTFTVKMDIESPNTLEHEQMEFTIVGIGKVPTRDWMKDTNIYLGIENEEALLPVLFTKEELKEKDNYVYNELLVYAPNVEQVESLSKSLKEDGYQVYSISDEMQGMNLFFTALKAGLIFVGTIAVLIASIGIFNTMTMAVTERTQEIGIIKAIGGDPRAIRKMFLMECAYIGILGSLIGVLVSYVISFGANFIIPKILQAVLDETGPIDFTFSTIPLSLVLISTGISVGVAVISGLRPAIKATNVNVLAALRREM